MESKRSTRWHNKLQTEPLEERRLLAATPELLAELNAGRDDANPTGLVELDGTTFFFANDDTHGFELWKTNGTEGGTQLVKDIRPGPGSSVADAGPITKGLGNYLYFWANDGTTGTELWRSNGTAAGTMLVRDIFPGTSSGGGGAMSAINDRLVFVARDSASNYEVWSTDGISTAVLAEIRPGTTGSIPSLETSPGFTTFNGELYFIADTDLWKTGGTSANTSRVKDFRNLSNIYAASDALYFSGDSSSSIGSELWKSDGTAAGTVLVKDIAPGSGSSTPRLFQQIGSTVFFSADTSTNGRELWKTDGTAAGTVEVADIYSGQADSDPGEFVNLNGTLLFAARSGTKGRELWKSDGTIAGTTMVKDIAPASSHSDPANLTLFDGALYFTATDVVNGRELWKSDGTEAGTALFYDFTPGGSSNGLSKLMTAGGKLFFTLASNSQQVWSTSGTPASTVPVTPPFDVLGWFAAAGGKYYFTKYEEETGRELWTTDLTIAGSQRIKDINTGSTKQSLPRDFTELGGLTYFVANSSQIWRTNGTGAGTELVVDLKDQGAGSIALLTTFNGALYFRASDPIHGFELWTSDGTAAGTQIFLDLRSGTASSGASYLKVHGERLVFQATDGTTSDSEYWVTDGTIEGTEKLFSGRSSATPEPVSVGSKLFLDSEDALYVSDGTPAGTGLLRAFTQISSALNVNGTLFFIADDGIHGTELWKSDGTVGGTQLVADIRTGNPSTRFAGIVELNGQLFFGVRDRLGNRQYELWSSDGTAAGTQPYYTLALESDLAGGLIRAGDYLFFSADGQAVGHEVFVTDGTAAGTRLVRDIRSGSSDIGKLHVVNETVFFVANDGSGKKFWTTDGSANGTILIGPAQPSNLTGSVTDVGGTAYFSVDEPWVLRTPSVSVDLDGNNARFGYDAFWSGTPVSIASSTATLFSAGTTVHSLTVRIKSPQPGDLLTANTSGTAIVASFNGAVLTLTGEDSVENYAQVLKSVKFHSNGGLVPTKLEVQARNSQGLLAVPSITTVYYSAAPQIDLNGQPAGNDTSVVWQGLAVNLSAPAALITDPDSGQLSQITLMLLQPEAGDQLTANTAGTAITATFNGTTLTLSGLDSLSNYQEVLQSVQYNYTGASPTFGSKQVAITATDSSGLAGLPSTATLNFVLHVDLNGPWGSTAHSVAWSGKPVHVTTPTASILAAGGVQLASLTVQVLASTSDDLLTAMTAGTNITAHFSGGTLTLSGIDSRMHYEQVLRSVKYQGLTPTGTRRELRFRVTDEFGSVSSQATTIVGIFQEAFIQPVRDIVPGPAHADLANYVGVESDVYFTAVLPDTGRELWKSDGTEAGTVLVKDIRPGTNSSGIEHATAFGGLLGFIANDGSGTGLWRSNGTDAGTYQLKSGNIQSLIEVAGELFFVSGEELWKSNGTVAGTTLVKDFNLSIPFDPRGLTTVGDLLFFGLDDGVHDAELWKSDGTEAGTVMVKDIGPGVHYGLWPTTLGGNGTPDLANINGVLYFVAHDGEYSRLWITDGTEAGTVIVGDGVGTYIKPNNYSQITNLNGTLAMVADAGIYGMEVFLGLGDNVVDINHPEGHSSYPGNLRVAGSTLYFTAIANTDDPVRQLWAKTLNTSYPRLIYDGIPSAMLNIGNTMFFIAGGTLWHSDGTTEGTKQVIQLGSPMLVSELGRTGDTLYFTANAGKGAEPYLLRLPTAATSVAGRHLLYENSKFSTPVANPSGGKDAAIAPDKVAYLGDGLATTSAVSSYSHGINGIVVDVHNASHALTAADFTFRMGGSNSPNTWVTAPAPTSVVVHAGMGEGNSDRIEITWADGAIKNTWLQVTVEGNDVAGGFNTNTGLAASDVFYFGSRVGDTFMNAPALSTSTTAQDELAARFNTGPNQALTSIYDFNRDGVVTAADQLIARSNVGVLKMLDIDELIDEELAASLVAQASSGRSALAFALAAQAFADDASDDLAGDLFVGPKRPRR